MYVTLTMMVGAIVHSLIVGQAGGELFFSPLPFLFFFSK